MLANKEKVNVLILRPAHQASDLIDAISQLGHTPFHFPTIEIVPACRAEALAKADLLSQAPNKDLPVPNENQLAHIDWIIWTSPNAVAHTPSAIFNLSACPIAIGPQTGQALMQKGQAQIVIPPKGANSEILAEYLNQKGVRGKKVLIIKGEGGRQVLAGMLQSLGASVTSLDVYRRQIPKQKDRHKLSEWMTRPNKICWVTSCEAFSNLLSMLAKDERAVLHKAKIFCASTRIAESVQHQGYNATALASAQDKDLLNTLS